MVGSLLHFRPFRLGGFELVYPRPPVAARQLLAGPLELVGAAGIIFFALPAAANPGFLVVLGVFVASFSLALVSHAPGGLGVLEIAFLEGMPDAPQANVVAALLVFRLLYLIVPFVFALGVVLVFERHRWRSLDAFRRKPPMPSAITIDDNDVLLAIDLQADFMPGGALAVGEGDAIVPVVNALMRALSPMSS